LTRKLYLASHSPITTRCSQVLGENCPDCPFLHGKSHNVPLPSAYNAHSGAAKHDAAAATTNASSSSSSLAAAATSGGAGGGAGGVGGAHPLESYLSGAVQKAAGPDAAVGSSAAAAGGVEISTGAGGMGESGGVGEGAGSLMVKLSLAEPP